MADGEERPHREDRARRYDHDEEVPEEVTDFIKRVSHNLLSKDIEALEIMYEDEMPKLTQKFYTTPPSQHRGPRGAGVKGPPAKHWPQPSVVKGKGCLSGQSVELLYQLLHLRSVYANDRMFSSVIRTVAWDAYEKAFDLLCDSDDVIDLPNNWVWDIIDEFLYQLTTNRIRRLRQESNPDVWSVQKSLQRLQLVVERTGIVAKLSAIEGGTATPAEITSAGSTHTKMMLGYASLVGIVKLHTLLGDYTAALSAAAPLGFNTFGPSISSVVPPLHATLYYNVGFGLLMRRRYAEADATLQVALTVQAPKTRNFLEQLQVNTVALLVLAATLGDRVLTDYSARFGDGQREDDITLLSHGDTDRFKEVFMRACPKFITATDTKAALAAETGQETKDLQVKVFMRAVDHRLKVLKLRGYLGVYSALTHEKAASLLSDKLPIEAHLVAMKCGAREVDRRGNVKRTGVIDFTSEHGNLSVQRHHRQPTLAASYFDRLNPAKGTKSTNK